MANLRDRFHDMAPDELREASNMAAPKKWRLEREIGHGAYGTVYLAVGPGGERAAVKVCRRYAVGYERYAR